MELDAALLRPGHLEDARRLHLTEIEFGIDVVVDDKEPMPFRQGDHGPVELNRRDSGGRIAGEIQAEQFDARGDAG